MQYLITPDAPLFAEFLPFNEIMLHCLSTIYLLMCFVSLYFEYPHIERLSFGDFLGFGSVYTPSIISVIHSRNFRLLCLPKELNYLRYVECHCYL